MVTCRHCGQDESGVRCCVWRTAEDVEDLDAEVLLLKERIKQLEQQLKEQAK